MTLLQPNPTAIKFEKYWNCGREYVCAHPTKFRAWMHTLLWPFHRPSMRVRMSYIYDKPKP